MPMACFVIRSPKSRPATRLARIVIFSKRAPEAQPDLRCSHDHAYGPSRVALYDDAVGTLGAQRDAWFSTSELLAKTVGPDLLNHSGADVVRMIESENHLSSGLGSSDSALMSAVLIALASIAWPSDPEGICRAYEQCLLQFTFQAPQIRTAPSRAFRYLNGYGFFEAIARALNKSEPTLAGLLRGLVDQAKNKKVTWTDVTRFVTRARVWNRLPRSELPLAFAQAMFVSFDGNPPLDRGSASKVHSALALKKPLQSCFIQLEYDLDAGDVLKFPTFVEAGWSRFFYSSAHSEPHGWTLPHDPEHERQPEAVTVTVSLERLNPAGLSVL